MEIGSTRYVSFTGRANLHFSLTEYGLKIQETNSVKATWRLARPVNDTYLVAIASGPGITSPHWAIPKPYQPSSKDWTPRVFGLTNPVWLDADGDGKFTPLRKQKR